MTEILDPASFLLGMFAILSLMCATLLVSLRHQTALVWMLGALLAATVMLFTLGTLPASRIELVIGMIGISTILFTIGQASRLILRQHRVYRNFWILLAAVTALCSVAVLLDLPALPFSILFKAISAYASIKIARRFITAEEPSPVDYFIAGLIAAAGATFIVRIGLWIYLFDLATPYTAFLRHPVETLLLGVAGTITAILIFLLAGRSILQLVEDLRIRSIRDEQTGLYRRDAFMRIAATERTGLGAVLFCDIDRFKLVNDALGHGAGDAVIAALADLIRANSRLAGRMGGDEFAILLPRTSADEAGRIAEHIRAEFAKTAEQLKLDGIEVSASFGIATYARTDTFSDALTRADEALLKAKRDGRNRLEMAPQGDQGPSRLWQKLELTG